VLALRSILLIRGRREAQYEAAANTVADAVTFDLAAPETHRERAEVRAMASQHASTIGGRGRAVHLRVADTRSGELEADLEATISASVAAVLLSGAEEPQDARDADVAVRRQEMRLGIEPGRVRLIPELDSALGVRALGRILEAVDRHSAVALNVERLARDVGLAALAAQAMPLIDHAMSEVSLTARAASVPWLLLAPHADPGLRSLLANRAHAFGAAGVYVRSESEAGGFNQLFAPPHEHIQSARAVLEEWERVRANEGWVGVAGDELVDRRSVRRARELVALDEAIHQRGRG
jgi:citrate lyase beta subunit